MSHRNRIDEAITYIFIHVKNNIFSFLRNFVTFNFMTEKEMPNIAAHLGQQMLHSYLIF